MLNPARRGGESENDATKAKLAHEGIEVTDSNPAFQLTHQKSMVIDDAIGFVESFNWETRDLTVTRDYAVVTTHKIEFEEMVTCFEADWARKKFNPGQHSRLIWCPNNGRERIANFIARRLAKQRLELQHVVIIVGVSISTSSCWPSIAIACRVRQPARIAPRV
jgi:cardiolipin synthase A/B